MSVVNMGNPPNTDEAYCPLGLDTPDVSQSRLSFVDELGHMVQVLVTVKYDGLHLRPISPAHGIAVDEDGYPVVIKD